MKPDQESEMDKLRQELLNDPKVRIGKNVLRDWAAERGKSPENQRTDVPPDRA
jgi:hypothetical protein